MTVTKKKSRRESIKCEGGVAPPPSGKGVIHHDFVPCGQTVDGQFYLEVMKCLREVE
jgi:hypothetical protein